MERLADLKLEPTETIEPTQKQSDSMKIQSIKAMLRLLAEARQADVSTETLRVYSRSLERFELQDIKEAVGILGVEERERGETAFPALATIQSRTRNASIRRKEQAQMDMLAAQSQYQAAHPEKFCTMKEVDADYAKLVKARLAGADIPNPGRMPEDKREIPAWESRMRIFQATIDALPNEAML